MPVVGLIPLVSSFAAVYTLGATYGWDLERIWEEMKKKVLGWVTQYALEKAGLVLDENDPLSDASLSGAVGQRLGIQIRTLKDRQSLEDDVLRGVSAKIEQVSGLYLSDLRSVDAIKADAMRYAMNRIAGETGIYLSDLTSPEAIKANILTWGKQAAMERVASDLSAALNLQDGDGVRLADMLASMGHAGLDPKKLMNQARSVLLGYAKEEMARAEVVGKKARRKLQNKINQRAFRARHKKGSPTYTGKGLPVYVPVGQ